MTNKKWIEAFFKSDAFINVAEMDAFLHVDFLLEWQSSKGFLKMSKQEVLNFTQEMSVSYVRTKIRMHDILNEKNQVAVRYSHFVNTVENPSEEILLAHFFALYEVKDNKIFRCFQMSQLS